MTLDTLIFKLETIRRDAGTGNLQVLFRDPADAFGVLYDEFRPLMREVTGSENTDVFSAFDLDVGDYYVEI